MEINTERQPSPIIAKPNINASSLLVGIHLLTRELAKQGRVSNFAFSPLSFHSTLSLIALGSEGPTLAQMLRFMRVNGVDELNGLASDLVSLVLSSQGSDEEEGGVSDGGPVVSFVNGAWLDRRFKLKGAFEDVARRVYGATAKVVDFLDQPDQAREEINKWAEEETRGRVKNLLPPDAFDDDDETIVILTNALYFKATWSIPFDISRTHYRDFHTLSGATVQVPFMTAGAANHKYLYASSPDHQLLKIPYRSRPNNPRRFSMCFFLPTPGADLAGLLNRVRGDHRVEERIVSPVWIPRFKFEFEVEASSAMREMGLQLPFSDMYGLTGMVETAGGDPVVLSKVFHKTVVEVNEEGTEAAGCSAGRIRGMRCRSAGPPSFVADRPFLFTIVEESSGSTLFLGALVNPLF